MKVSELKRELERFDNDVEVVVGFEDAGEMAAQASSVTVENKDGDANGTDLCVIWYTSDVLDLETGQ